MHESQPEFLFQLQKILADALKNIDEEKFYTKHIFDRFDIDALISAFTSHASVIACAILICYIFKRC